ncbi:MAG: DUF11 domain-containing protein [Candidatus Peribacteraceae bacterium]|nr:DUF11 domain-containing protein [Candidatus Peribacteraceae bacterium]
MKKLLNALPLGAVAIVLSAFVSVAHAAPIADLSIATTGPATVSQGDTITYTLTVTNNSAPAPFSYVISNPIPAGTTFVSASFSYPVGTFGQMGCSLQSETVVCKYYAAGRTPPPSPTTSSVKVTFRLLSTACNPISNTATVSPINTTDPNMANNQSTTTTTVPGAANCPSPYSDGTLDVSINGPATQSHARNEQDVVMANAGFSATVEPQLIQKMFVAIQGNSITGGALTNPDGSPAQISSVLENVELRNIVTGQVISGVRLLDAASFGQASGGTYQIYRFDNVPVSSTAQTQEQLRLDFIDNGTSLHPIDGDTFKAHICTESKQLSSGVNPTGCTFGGLVNVSNSIAYQMDVQGSTSGYPVVTIQPGGTVTGNQQKILNPGLTVAVKSIGTANVAVANQKNVNLLRFESTANETADLLLTKIILKAATGSLQNAQNYSLWVDTDANGGVDTKLQGGVTAQNGKLTFSQLVGGGYVLPKTTTVAFEAHADISASLTSNTLQVQFSSSDIDYISAENVANGTVLAGIRTNGSCTMSSCDITVTTVASMLYTLKNQGSLYVTKDSTPTRNRQLLGGSLGEPILRLTFRAESEDIDVTDLQVSSVNGLTLRSVSKAELYKVGETTPFASATVGGCGTDIVPPETLCAQMDNGQLIVPKNVDVIVLVKLRMKLDDEGAVSGDPIQLLINSRAIADNATGEGAVRARGVASSNSLSANNGNATAEGEMFIGRSSPASTNMDIVGNDNVTVLSKITSITNANPDANGTNVPTGISDIGQFKFTASPNGNSKNGLNKVVLSGVIFNVQATNVAIATSSLHFYNKATSGTTAPCTAMRANGSVINGTASGFFLAVCSSLNAAGVDTVINQGNDQTFVLQANITNSRISSFSISTLQVSLQNFSDKTLTTLAANSSHFKWFDTDTVQTPFLWVEYPDTTVKSTSYQS